MKTLTAFLFSTLLVTGLQARDFESCTLVNYDKLQENGLYETAQFVRVQHAGDAKIRLYQAQLGELRAAIIHAGGEEFTSAQIRGATDHFTGSSPIISSFDHDQKFTLKLDITTSRNTVRSRFSLNLEDELNEKMKMQETEADIFKALVEEYGVLNHEVELEDSLFEQLGEESFNAAIYCHDMLLS